MSDWTLFFVLLGLCAIFIPVGIVLKKKSSRSSAVPDNIPSDISLSGGIEHCPGGSPGDAVKCTFQPEDTSTSAYRVTSIIGTPVENCSSSNQTVQTTIGGQATITQQWSESASVDFAIIFLNISGGGDWSQSKSWEVEQTVSITVTPGQQAALSLEVLNNVTVGRMLMQYSKPVHGFKYWYVGNVTLYQPTNDTIYNVPVIDCGASFGLPRAPFSLPADPHSGASLVQPNVAALVLVFVTLLFVTHQC